MDFSFKDGSPSPGSQSNVIPFAVLKNLQERKKQENDYRESLKQMQKFELLENLLEYDDQMKKNPDNVKATIRAQMIMEALEERAELRELKDLAHDYKKKLATKLYQQVQSISTTSAGAAGSIPSRWPL